MQFKSNNLSVWRLIACGIVIVFSGACTEAPRESYQDKVPLVYAEGRAAKADWPSDGMLEQFSGYWYYRFAGDVDETWTREAPHFQAMAGRDFYNGYILSGAVHELKTLEVRRIERVSDNLFRVLIRLSFQRVGRELSTNLNDNWVLLDDQWYHVMRDPLAFPFSATLDEMG